MASGPTDTTAIQIAPSMTTNNDDAEPALPVIPSTGASPTAPPSIQLSEEEQLALAVAASLVEETLRQ